MSGGMVIPARPAPDPYQLGQMAMIAERRRIAAAIATMRSMTRYGVDLPRLIVDPDTMFLTCPDCGADDSVCAVDWTFGKHRMLTFSVGGERVLFTADERDLDETVAYVCGQCGTYVALPENWKEEWA